MDKHQAPNIESSLRGHGILKMPAECYAASGGPTGDGIKATIEAGANAVKYTPPGTAELFRSMMANYREQRAAKPVRTSLKAVAPALVFGSVLQRQ